MPKILSQQIQIQQRLKTIYETSGRKNCCKLFFVTKQQIKDFVA